MAHSHQAEHSSVPSIDIIFRYPKCHNLGNGSVESDLLNSVRAVRVGLDLKSRLAKPVS